MPESSAGPDRADAEDLALIAAAAREAGALIRAAYATTLKPRYKADGGPVTEADLAADALLRERLMGARADYGWLSEESVASPDRLTRKRVFIVDPLDGTRAFLKREPGFCTAIAVVGQGAPRAAAIYDPIADRLYTAVQGGGARCNGEPIFASRRSVLEGARMVGSPGFYKDRRWPKPWPPVEARPKNALSQRLSLIAEGSFDGFVALGHRHEWDVAPGALLVTEAGGRITTPWGDRLLFNQPEPRVPGAVAAGADLHPLLLDLTRATAPP